MYSLKIKVIEAKNLVAKDTNGFSDPFCVIKVGQLSLKTEVISKNLNPVWNQEFEIQLKPELVKENLLIEIFDKDIFGKDFLGSVTIPIPKLINESPLYDEALSNPIEYTLESRKSEETVRGSLILVAGFSQLPEFLLEVRKSMESLSYNLNQKRLSDDDVYFNHFIGEGSSEENQSSDDNISIDNQDDAFADETIDTKENATLISSDSNENSEQQASDIIGLLRLDIESARNLPRVPNLIRSTFDSDPFVIISFGSKVFKTRKNRHTLNPIWNERLYLQISRQELDMNHSISFHIYDHDKITSHDSIGVCKIQIKDIIDRCPQPACVPDIPSRTESQSITLPLNLTVPANKLKEPTDSIFNFSASFISQRNIRRNFWISLAKLFDSDNNGKINRVELVTMLDSIGSTFSQETIDRIFHPLAEWSYEEVFEDIENLFLNKNSFKVSLESEHLIQMSHCPLCRKKISLKHDLNTVSHIALCSINDFSKMDSFVMNGFLTERYTTRKWYTKIISYVAHGSYGIGKNNANIIVKNRETGQLFEEKIPAYIRLGIRLLYQRAGSTAVDRQTIRNLLQSLTYKQGKKFDDPSSVKHIPSFIKFHRLDVKEMKYPLESYKTFNEFFYRELKDDARKLASSDSNIAVSPADCRLLVFPTIKEAISLWIKGKNFTISNLLQDEKMAARYKDGSIVICRLAPQDYHRFHIPVDGHITPPKRIQGDFFTVNPMAIRTSVDVYTDNVRTLSFIDSPQFGTVAYVCVGAMMVGSIQITSQSDRPVTRLQEHGYFAFGGSTILLLFEKDVILFDKDLVDNSGQCLETLVKVGHSIGVSKKSL